MPPLGEMEEVIRQLSRVLKGSGTLLLCAINTSDIFARVLLRQMFGVSENQESQTFLNPLHQAFHVKEKLKEGGIIIEALTKKENCRELIKQSSYSQPKESVLQRLSVAKYDRTYTLLHFPDLRRSLKSLEAGPNMPTDAASK